MTNKEKIERGRIVVSKLKELYPDAVCTLEYCENAWQLLEMTRLSAQCTDERVNKVSGPLFKRYPTPYDMANADIEELESLIFSCGMYHTKARDLKLSSRMIIEEFDGKVPDNMEDLLKLPGVGRKIANLILGDVYKKPSVVTDTHCIRISYRLGLTESHDPHKAEKELREIIEEKEQTDYCHRIVDFGRDVCKAQNPKCDLCPFKDFGCRK